MDQHHQTFHIHGLSGITYLGKDCFWAEMDNSNKIIRLSITTKADGSIDQCRVMQGLLLAMSSDFEGIAYTGAARNTVYLSEETTPGIHEFRLADGSRVRNLITPDVFLHGHTVSNRGFESLSLSPDGKSLWTANESALTVDGAAPTQVVPFGSTTRVRLVHYHVGADGIPVPGQQYIYQTAGVHELAGFNGLSDLVALPDGRLLALERSAGISLSGAKSIRTRIFLVDVRGATDVSRPPFDHGIGASNAATQPVGQTKIVMVKKMLLLNAILCDSDGENLEGLCLGRPLGPNRWSIIGVVDDTDGGMNVSHSQVIAFELKLPD